MLNFIGLGLSKDGLTVKGLNELKKADVIYAEFYTSLIPGLDINELSEEIGKEIKVLDREKIEDDPHEVLGNAEYKIVSFLVPGDPMIATTHVDLRLRAEKMGIETNIIHGVSIETAAPGLTGLQSYKFGRSATIPFSEKPSITPYEVLNQNRENGSHTLLLLDIESDERRYLTANEAMKIMLDIESRERKDAFTHETLIVVIARAGSDAPLVKGGRVCDLIKSDFGSPPHVLIAPGRLHFLEAEALNILSGAPDYIVDNHVK